MILLDTHIWVWWVNGSAALPEVHKQYIDSNEQEGLAVSIMTCWEVANLVQKNRLTLSLTVLDWIDLALNYPGMLLLNLTPAIIVEAHELPGAFHRDPVDRLLVATARFGKLNMMTLDTKILEYPHVATWKSDEAK
jgi:PIN domain nuclease of toxin-antitoxin system